MPAELVMVIDDEQSIRESLSGILSDEGYRVLTAASAEEGIELLSRESASASVSLVFLDVWLPGMDGLEALLHIRRISPETAVIMISGHGTIETAVKATTSGAYDFIEKPLSLERVVLAAKRALEQKTLVSENRALKETLSRRWQLVGESPIIKQVRSQIALAARSNSRVLITGQSGTGKEIVARLLHDGSDRAPMPFIEVNCAAIPQELIESELFGHEKGSFTGAFEMKKGKFELADKGTLFLDEIADMSFNTQAKLLRVLESQQFQRVGGSKSITVDTRVVAATNKDMPALIKENKFRDDLYFRLNVIPIHLPPLSERKDDIPLLVEHFLGLLAAEYRQPGKRLLREAMEALMAHNWPGNIRELKNLIERLVIMTPGEEIGPAGVTAPAQGQTADIYAIPTLREARDAFEREFIMRKLAEHGNNVSKTAEAIDLERSNLHRKIKSLNIEGH